MAELASVSLLVAANKDAIFGGKFSASTDIVFSSIPQDKPTEQNQGGLSSNVVISALGGPMVMFFLIIASLFASFILLAFEWKKAQKIIKSRDISYAFTSKVAYSYYTIRSYPHYCFFSQIQNSRKPVDVLAFWVFFKFKGIFVFFFIPRMEEIDSCRISSSVSERFHLGRYLSFQIQSEQVVFG